MAYLGEEPKFGSFASETFSGNGSATSFTLTHGAASPSSLLVTIDGVKQQTTAYTITDTALDFGAGNAPAAGTNNIEVVYLGTKSLVGAVADGAITTSKIAANAVTGAKIAMGSDAAGDILTYTGTDYVRLAKGTASQTLKMNSGASAVEWATVAPASDNTPSFFAFLATNFTSTYATYQKLPMGSEHWDTDSDWDTTNYKFVVPAGEAGKYSFTWHLATNDHAAGTDMTHGVLYLNGVQQIPTTGTNEGAAQYVQYSTTAYLTLAVSDYIELYVYTTSNNTLVFQGSTGVGSKQCWLEGHKLVGV